jgi:hypothetical protein
MRGEEDCLPFSRVYQPCTGRFARDRQIYLIHLADAYARPGPRRDLEATVDWVAMAVNRGGGWL